MAPKVGRIVRWGRTGRTFTEAFLESGQRVELTDELRRQAEAYGPRTLVFVERRGRVFRFVQWVGTPADAIAAVRAGELKQNEIDAQTQFLAEAEARLAERICESQVSRGRQMLELIARLLPPNGPLTLTEVARFARASITLTDADLEVIRDRSESSTDLGGLETMSKISGDALRIGSAVRAIRWPGPSDPADVPAFRVSVSRAALTLEWAIAAMAEPALTTDERAAIYWPLEPVIPLESIRDPS